MDSCTCFTETNNEHTDDCELIGPDFDQDFWNRIGYARRLNSSIYRSDVLMDTLVAAQKFHGLVARQLKGDLCYERIETGEYGRQVMAELVHRHRSATTKVLEPEIIDYGRNYRDFTFSRHDAAMQNRYFGIPASNAKQLHVLDDDAHIYHMIQQLFFGTITDKCDLELAVNCKYIGRDILTLVSGNQIGVFYSCKNCLRWFSTGEAPARAVVRPLLHTRVPNFENATPEALEVDGSF